MERHSLACSATLQMLMLDSLSTSLFCGKSIVATIFQKLFSQHFRKIFCLWVNTGQFKLIFQRYGEIFADSIHALPPYTYKYYHFLYIVCMYTWVNVCIVCAGNDMENAHRIHTNAGGSCMTIAFEWMKCTFPDLYGKLCCAEKSWRIVVK